MTKNCPNWPKNDPKLPKCPKIAQKLAPAEKNSTDISAGSATFWISDGFDMQRLLFKSNMKNRERHWEFQFNSARGAIHVVCWKQWGWDCIWQPYSGNTYFSTLFLKCIFQLYFSNVLFNLISQKYFRRCAIYVQVWCRWKQGGRDNKEQYWFPLGGSALWAGIQLWRRNSYLCPVSGGEAGSEEISFQRNFFFFFICWEGGQLGWDGFDVTDKKTELTAAVVGSFFFVQPSPSQDESVHGDWDTGMLPQPMSSLMMMMMMSMLMVAMTLTMTMIMMMLVTEI